MLKSKLIPTLICMILVIGLVGAYDSHKQNTDLNYVEEVANADSCVLSSINYPDGTSSYVNATMDKSHFNFNYTILSGNFSQLGDTCIKITCYDASATPEYESGVKCLTITTTANPGTIFLIILLYSLGIIFFIATWFVDEEFFVYITGLFFLLGGIFLMIYGIDFLNDWMTRGIAFISIGIGFLFTIGAYIYNSYSKYQGDEEDYE